MSSSEGKYLVVIRNLDVEIIGIKAQSLIYKIFTLLLMLINVIKNIFLN